MELGAWPFASEECELGASSFAAWVVWISKGSRRVGLVVGVLKPEEFEVAIFEAGRGRSAAVVSTKAAVWFALISRRSDRRDGPRMLPYVLHCIRR